MILGASGGIPLSAAWKWEEQTEEISRDLPTHTQRTSRNPWIKRRPVAVSHSSVGACRRTRGFYSNGALFFAFGAIISLHSHKAAEPAVTQSKTGITDPTFFVVDVFCAFLNI